MPTLTTCLATRSSFCPLARSVKNVRILERPPAPLLPACQCIWSSSRCSWSPCPSAVPNRQERRRDVVVIHILVVFFNSFHFGCTCRLKEHRLLTRLPGRDGSGERKGLHGSPPFTHNFLAAVCVQRIRCGPRSFVWLV